MRLKNPTAATLAGLRNGRARTPLAGRPRRADDGFTLIEAVIATAILVFGLAAVSNLIFVAISSNTLANRMTTSSFLASQKMEQLRSIPFDNAALADSLANSLDVDQAAHNENIVVASVGTFHTRWNVRTVAAFGTSLKFVAVRTEFSGPLGRQSRAEFTTYRACTLTGCAP
ncbi:MAG: prepilin-type N-terminal cleavage/methylation domain-containing protein [Vicinamibacteria bacterium]|nr:prepilin-type N-terminal cleavage/methylation domain-containing protein [Vicinamibacteria bacterium]